MLLKKNIPCLGICLGLQTLVKAAGGQVIRNPVKEIGLRMDGGNSFTCDLTPAARKDPLLEGLPEQFPIFQLHGETVELDNSMVLLAEGKTCRNQIVKIRNLVYGLQGHLEITRRLLSSWIKEDADLKTVDSQKLLRDMSETESELHLNCRKILMNFLKIAKMIS